MKLVLILSVFMISFSGQSQITIHNASPKDSSANCIAYWKMGETKVYSIIHKKETTDPAKKSAPFEFAYEAWVSVIDSTAKTYTVKWVFHLPSMLSILRPDLANSLPVYNGMQMIFKTTEMGEFVELLNWEEVRNTYSKMMELSLPKKMDSTATAGLKVAESMFNSREMVQSSMIREIQLFHIPYGYKFTTRTVNARAQISNPFGGDPFPAIQTAKVTGLSPQKDYFSIAFNLRIDNVSMKTIIDSILSKLSIKDDKEMQAARETYASIDIHDFSEYDIIRSSGWIRRLHYVRTVVTAGTIQSDTYTITLKD